MRYILFICFFAFSSSAFTQSNAIDKYFSKYVENDDFTSVFISPKMFELISRIDLSEVDSDPEAKLVMDVVSELKGLRVLTTDVDPGTRYKEAMNMINTNEYETLMTVKDGDENVRFWVKDSGDIINELLLIVGGDDEFVLLSFVGNIDLAKISKLANQIDVKGAEHLRKIENGKEQ